jgi:hypothetical protein
VSDNRTWMIRPGDDPASSPIKSRSEISTGRTRSLDPSVSCFERAQARSKRSRHRPGGRYQNYQHHCRAPLSARFGQVVVFRGVQIHP